VHATSDQLVDGLAHLRPAPLDEGTLQLLVRRPGRGAREVVTEASIDAELGMIGDTWISRPSRRNADGRPDPRSQITLVDVRAAELVAGDIEHWPMFGDQLYVELDLSERNLPAGSRLAIGTAVLEISDKAHTGCAKFASRFGTDALRFVMSPEGRRRRLRGANARVIRSGTVRVGDPVSVQRALGASATTDATSPNGSRG
jgi:hypothetical protein